MQAVNLQARSVIRTQPDADLQHPGTYELVGKSSSVAERLSNFDRTPLAGCCLLRDAKGICFGDFYFTRAEKLLNITTSDISQLRRWRDWILDPPLFGDQVKDSLPFGLSTGLPVRVDSHVDEQLNCFVYKIAATTEESIPLYTTGNDSGYLPLIFYLAGSAG